MLEIFTVLLQNLFATTIVFLTSKLSKIIISYFSNSKMVENLKVAQSSTLLYEMTSNSKGENLSKFNIIALSM